jgi:hypothetical protein
LEVLSGLSDFLEMLVEFETCGAIRGEWRILDEKVESGLDYKFRAPRW